MMAVILYSSTPLLLCTPAGPTFFLLFFETIALLQTLG
jgi:hypothetical protein